jgi:hypothetical protein
MRVWVYPEREWAELGAERWEVEWQTVKPGSRAKAEIDPDCDIDWHCRQYPTKAKALAAARGVVNLGRTAYGCATVTRQVVDWYVEEDRVAEWADAADPIYVP